MREPSRAVLAFSARRRAERGLVRAISIAKKSIHPVEQRGQPSGVNACRQVAASEAGPQRFIGLPLGCFLPIGAKDAKNNGGRSGRGPECNRRAGPIQRTPVAIRRRATRLVRGLPRSLPQPSPQTRSMSGLRPMTFAADYSVLAGGPIRATLFQTVRGLGWLSVKGMTDPPGSLQSFR